MSEDDLVATVKDFYTLVLGGEAEKAIRELLAPDFVWENPLPSPIPFGGVFPGTEGAERYLAAVFSTLELADFGIDEVVASADRVVVLGHETARVRSTGRGYTQDWVHVLRVRGGRITHVREYNDSAAIRDAFA